MRKTVIVDCEETAYLLYEVEELINNIDWILSNEDAVQYSDEDVSLFESIDDMIVDITLDNFAYERGEL